MTTQTSSRNSWSIWIEAIRGSLTSQGVLFLVFAAGCVGIFYAKALLSIFSGVIFGVALLNVLLKRDALKALKTYTPFIALMCIVLVYVVSGMHSDDTRRWAKLAWESVPYAAIPLGFYVFRNVPGGTWRRLLLIFIGVSTLSTLSLMIEYAMHFEEYNALYKIGKTIPTPIIHVRYSYFIALAACLAFALAYESKEHRAKGIEHRAQGEHDLAYESQSITSDRSGQQLTANGQWPLLLIGAFLTIVVHVLAVRTGLIALYGGLGMMMAFLIFRDGKWKLGVISAVAIIILVVIAYMAFPSVANKIGYVMYDLKMMKEQGALAEYSDNVRITSIRHGLNLLKENLITGVGIGDLKAEMIRMYQEKTPNFPAESRFPPISQYVFILTAFGIVGAAVFFYLLLFPLFRSPFTYVMLAIYSSTLFGSIGETTIELVLGKTVFVSLVCIGLFYGIQKSAE